MKNTNKEEVLIIKNIPRENAGLLLDVIKERGIESRVIDLSLGERADSAEKYAAVVVLGGPDSANDDSPKMKYELELIKEVLDAGIPYLGICLGLQTMVKAAGGEVVKNPVAETGFRDPEGRYNNVVLTASGRRDPLFDGIEDNFNVFHLHGETVILTGKMELLAEGKYCRNQVVKAADKVYGIQCHFELTHEMFETWIREDPELLKLDREQLRSDFRESGRKYTETGIKLFHNFLSLAGFR
ncbi:MAG: type 1 glutamine amidotransferase [Bacteroidales bacterium]|nr:type 1 glutamine amidotransferase [Bacteroidales bacterium]